MSKQKISIRYTCRVVETGTFQTEWVIERRILESSLQIWKYVIYRMSWCMVVYSTFYFYFLNFLEGVLNSLYVIEQFSSHA